MFTLDKSIFYFINKVCSNGFFDSIMPWLTNFGNPEFLLIAGVILLFSKNRKLKIAGLSLIAGLLVSFYAVHYLKIWIARPRPFVVLPDVHRVIQETGFSFPSAHSTNIFMAAALLSVYSKKCRYLYILACIVAVSRIYLGVHYPSDVIGGALLGIILGHSLGRIIGDVYEKH